MKKILAILLAMVMTFGLLTGCNKSQPDKPNGDNSDIVIGVVSTTWSMFSSTASRPVWRRRPLSWA